MKAPWKLGAGSRVLAPRRQLASPSLRHRVTTSLLTFALLMACAGCAQYGVTETHHFTTEHAFTDAAAARAQKDADGICERKKLVAVKTTGACSLNRCTTHFQCMTQADAAKYKQ